MSSPLLTATAAAATPELATLLPLAALAWITWRLLAAWLFPYAPCRRCHGTGKHRSGHYFRPCHRCTGTGRRLRIGRRIWNWTRTTDHHA